MYWGVEVKLHSLSTSAIDRGEWSALRLALFNPRGKAQRANWIGGWVDLRTCLVAVEKYNSLLLPGIEPRSSSL